MDVQQLKTIAFWRQLLPQHEISEQATGLLTSQGALPNVALSREALITEGYQQFDGVIGDPALGLLQSGVASLQDQGWLPVFAMAYDVYWMFVASLRDLIVSALGDEALMLPDFWIWYVDPRHEQAGWAPHRDKPGNTLLDDGMPQSATVWIALTDATPLNGCMYLLPADRDPDYRNWDNNVPNLELQSVRALAAPAGSVFIWNQRIFHWGSKSSRRAPEPRISMAFEFQRGDVAPFNEPLMPLQILPEFDLRLKLIAKQILQYRHMYGYTDELVGAAESLLQ